MFGGGVKFPQSNGQINFRRLQAFNFSGGGSFNSLNLTYVCKFRGFPKLVSFVASETENRGMYISRTLLWTFVRANRHVSRCWNGKDHFVHLLPVLQITSLAFLKTPAEVICISRQTKPNMLTMRKCCVLLQMPPANWFKQPCALPTEG